MSMLRYLELKSGHGDSGPAWIARVKLSRSKTTVYFNGRALKKAKGGGISGNYFDLESGEEFWISGIKKNGKDRHWASTVGIRKLVASRFGKADNQTTKILDATQSDPWKSRGGITAPGLQVFGICLRKRQLEFTVDSILSGN